MADYIYMMESRLTPEQQRAVALIADAARAHEMNIFITGGTVRDVISGFPIRDVDLTVEGNPLKLQKDLEKAGASIQDADEDYRELYLTFAGSVRISINMARRESYPKPGRPPEIASASIMDDLRRRDFTVNAIALSLNPGSRGLLLDPSNGVADIEAKVLRVLHNYSFLEDPSRLIRVTRFIARFHWNMEERTQARYNAALEGNYIEHLHNERAVGQEAEQLAYEDEPLPIMKALEKEGWLKVLHPHWSVAKVDTAGLTQLLKTRQQMAELGYSANIAPAVMYFLTARLSERETNEIQKHILHKGLVKAWQHLESDAKDLAHRLTGKEAATPSRTWHLLSAARPELIIFLETTSRQQSVVQKIRNYLGKWRQVKQRFPLPEMIEMRITPDLPIYPKLIDDMFFLMLDGKLRNSTEIRKFLRPYEPPPPPPPPPPPVKRGRGAKAEAAPATAGAAPAQVPVQKGKGRKKKGAEAVPVAAPAPPPAQPATQGKHGVAIKNAPASVQAPAGAPTGKDKKAPAPAAKAKPPEQPKAKTAHANSKPAKHKPAPKGKKKKR
ncbi:MAG TPA: CCA tRNA nucleotidyltransferase [Terriglobales bacterium]|nr:CCA tRNA nucleotidyltransferase [Terriglobales bacterium]